MASGQQEQASKVKKSTRSYANYLDSPVDILLASLEDESQERVSTHVVLQAYGLLAARVKKLSDALRDDGQRASAVAYLQKNALNATKCLTRDIRKSLKKFPMATTGRGDDGDDVRVAMSDEDIRDARECAALAQGALALVAQISCESSLNELFGGTPISYFLFSVPDSRRSPSARAGFTSARHSRRP